MTEADQNGAVVAGQYPIEVNAGIVLTSIFQSPPVPTSNFIGLCLVTGGLLVALILVLKARRASSKARERAEQRNRERVAESRQLQDSLLQNTQGLILRFQAVAERMPPSDPTRHSIEEVLARAEQVLADETERVVGLSEAAEAGNDLVQAFATAGKELLLDRAVRFQALADGAPRELDSVAREEIYSFGHEALSNAGRHSTAQAIEIQIVYGEHHLALRVRDDGRGVEAQVLEASARTAHSGLAKMRANATRLNARMEVWSRSGAGTEVELRVPARVAYRPEFAGS